MPGIVFDDVGTTIASPSVTPSKPGLIPIRAVVLPCAEHKYTYRYVIAEALACMAAVPAGRQSR